MRRTSNLALMVAVTLLGAHAGRHSPFDVPSPAPRPDPQRAAAPTQISEESQRRLAAAEAKRARRAEKRRGRS